MHCIDCGHFLFFVALLRHLLLRFHSILINKILKTIVTLLRVSLALLVCWYIYGKEREKSITKFVLCHEEQDMEGIRWGDWPQSSLTNQCDLFLLPLDSEIILCPLYLIWWQSCPPSPLFLLLLLPSLSLSLSLSHCCTQFSFWSATSQTPLTLRWLEAKPSDSIWVLMTI